MKKFFIDIVFLIVGSFVLAAGVNIFLVPNEISAGGVSGIATILYILFSVPLSVAVISINIILFLFGFKTLKKRELIKSFLGIIFLSLFLELPMPIYTENLILASLFGGVVCGVGITLVVMRGASTGGTDMFAVMVLKKTKSISYGTVIFIVDAVIVVISGIAFSSITAMFYAAICVYVQAKIVDKFAIMGGSGKQMQIFSQKADEIANKILLFGRGVTGVYIKGYFSGNNKTMLICVVSPRETGKVINIIKDIDKNAFITISEVREVFGEGFQQIN